MYRKKYNKLRKLKKKHVWPPILVFMIYVVVIQGVFIASTTLLTENTVKTKFEQNSIEVEYLAKLYDSRSSSVNDGTALTYVIEHNQNYGDLAVLGENNTIIQEAGSITANFIDIISINKDKDQSKLFYDQYGEQSWISRNGKVDLPFQQIFKNAMSDFDDKSTEWMDDVVYKKSYWESTPLESSQSSLLARCNLVLYRKDLIQVLAVGGLLAALLLIPSIVLFINIIDRIKTQHQMYQLFYYDDVTKGKNWLYFVNYVEHLLTSRLHSTKSYAIVDLQLEKYRSICSCYGVNAGETLLEMIHRTINQEFDRRELCVRYAKSNFAMILTCDNEIEGKERVDYLISKISESTQHNRLSFHAGLYMIYPEQKASTGQICRRTYVDVPQIYTFASEARATVEENEGSAVAVFDQNMIDDQLWLNWVENNMELALQNNEFIVYLQPKYNPVNDTLVGAEALVRWISGERGFITPNRFIPIFENNGFIMKLDDYMVMHVAELQARWIAEGRPVVPISVNISRVHFRTENLAEHLCDLVDIYQTPHETIEIELTESAFFEDKKVLLKTVKKLKEYGFELSMDDFGAGYSSLNTLKDLPLDVLKLDADFFRGEDLEKRGDIIVGETIQLAKNLRMRTVAEGIETKEQVEFLAQKGCDMIQGYYYAKPMPIVEYEHKYKANLASISSITEQIQI